MEQAEGKMDEHSDEQRNAIRKYLLGSLNDKVKMRQIEESLLLDDGFAEQLSVSEDELIGEYLDGTLTEPEREQFLRFFLISPENKEKLRLIQNLRRYAAKHASRQDINQFPREKPARFEWRFLLSSPVLRFALIALLIFGAGFGIWRTAFYQSDVDRGLTELRLAFRGQRPTVSRTTADFEYAPIIETRGGKANSATDEKAQRRAENLLLEAAQNASNAEAHHALGLLYLAQKEYDKAADEFDLALKFSPDNAKIHSDLGSVWYEMSKKAALEKDGAKNLEFLDRSLRHLDKAIELDPNMPEPRFNRALSLQALFVSEPRRAAQAWREYLTIDANSPWADEARRNLQILESQNTEGRSAAELERDFLTAFRQNDDEEAWRLLSRNRELIREKYLPQRLAMSYLTAPDSEKETYLQALQYAGELELTRIKDPFAAEISRFYAALPSKKNEFLKQAQQNLRNGYELCLKLEYRSALKEFNKAHNLFRQAGDIWETKLTEYLIGYSLKNDNRLNLSASLFDGVAKFSRQQNYKWLEVTSLYWSASSLVNAKQVTEAKRIHERALALAEEINDSYAVQRNVLELANLSAFTGQRQQSLDYLQRVLSAPPETSLRQKYRNYADAHQILIRAKFHNAAKEIALAAVRIADDLNDEMFMTLSRNNAGIVYSLAGNFEEARRWVNEGQKKAEAISDKSSREKMLAYSFLKSGYLERQAGEYENAERFYKRALELYETMEMPFNSYEAQKGKLLTYRALGKDAEMKEQIPATLKLLEKYREKILEEQERTSFFDTEESIYDIATDYEYGRGSFERAYDYAETSNARSLLDWLQKGAQVSGDKKKLEILLQENVTPLTLAEIREQMPDGAQILQYSILDNKVLIWLISKEKFIVVPVNIQSAELEVKVETYVNLLKLNKNTARAETERLSHELYELLVSPVYGHLNPGKEICLIPSKILFYLPFAALLSANEKPLLADFNIIYSPSANVFIYCSENARKKHARVSETLLSVGNPAFDHQNFDLPDLPTAEKEAREITAYYDKSRTFFGVAATKTAFKDSLKDADIIHFAGHYVVVNDAPLSSYLLMARVGEEKDDGILANSELVAVKLPRAKLVVLSACQTGVERYYSGEGLIGLSRTFLAAGAPLVVASQWSVETAATAELMKRFHFYRRQEKMTTAAALRTAQLEMFNEPDGRYKAPYYWAGFAAFGGYAAF